MPHCGTAGPVLPTMVHAVLNPKPCVFPGKYKRHLNSALGGALHRAKMPCFHDPFAQKEPQRPKNQLRVRTVPTDPQESRQKPHVLGNLPPHAVVPFNAQPRLQRAASFGHIVSRKCPGTGGADERFGVVEAADERRQCGCVRAIAQHDRGVAQQAAALGAPQRRVAEAARNAASSRSNSAARSTGFIPSAG